MMGRIGNGFVRASDVLEGRLRPEDAQRLEIRFGNADLVRTALSLDLAGPFAAAGAWELEDGHGVRLINAGGYGALPFGEFDEELIAFAREYLDRSRHMSLPQQAASAWRAALAHNLIMLLAQDAPSHRDSHVYFSNGGAEAIEVAAKIARAARPGAPVLISFTGGYHGESWMALSLTPDPDAQGPFRPMVPDVVSAPYGDIAALSDLIADIGPARVAAVVLEPVQGEGGVIVPPDDYLAAVGELCRAHGILVVADEIQTGLGRTGHWFESTAQGLEPDVLTLAKPLGGGLVPISVTIARRGLSQRAFGGLGCSRAVTTFGGSSLPVAIALKSLELIAERGLVERAARLGAQGLARLHEIQRRHPRLLTEVRGAGLLYGLQFRSVAPPSLLRQEPEVVADLSGLLGLQALRHAGVYANLSANASGVVRLTPPLTIPEPLFEEMWRRVERAAAHNHHPWQLLLHTRPRTLRGLTRIAETR